MITLSQLGRVKFMRFKLSLFSLFLGLGSFFSSSLSAQEIGGYLPQYRLFSAKKFATHEALDPEDVYLSASRPVPLTPYNALTVYRRLQPVSTLEKIYPEQTILQKIDRLYYFAAEPNPQSGELSKEWEQRRDMPLFYWFRTISERLKIFLVLRGSSEHFLPVLEDVEKEKRLIKELDEFVLEGELDGVDIDWEFPNSPEERELLISFVEGLRRENQKMEVGIAVNPNVKADTLLFEEVDFINVMAYDLPGRHSTYAASEAAVQNLILRYDAPLEKLFLGIPFYGKGHVREKEGWGKAKSYRELAKSVDFNRNRLDLNEIDSFYFNGPDLVKEKTKLAVDLGIGGVFIWELGQDSFYGGVSLLDVISEEIKRPKSP